MGHIGFGGAFGGGQAAGTLVTSQRPVTVSMPNPYQINSQAPIQNMELMAAQQQANNLNNQGGMAVTQAMNNAANVGQQAQLTESAQALAYDGSGVQLAGSPLMNIEFTRQKAQQQVNNLMVAGVAQADLFRQQANQALNVGYASMLGQQATQGAQSTGFNAQQAMARISALAGQGSPFANALQNLGQLGGTWGQKAKGGGNQPQDPLTSGVMPPLAPGIPGSGGGMPPVAPGPFRDPDPPIDPYYGTPVPLGG